MSRDSVYEDTKIRRRDSCSVEAPEGDPALTDRVRTDRLSDEQIARLRTHGEVLNLAAGDVLFREGDPSYDFFVILSGRLVVLDGYGTAAERELAEGGPGDFVAELNLFTGERLYTTAVVREAASMLSVPRAALVEMIGTDSDLADVVIPTVFARREWLTRHRAGVRIVGSQYSADTVRLREFAARNRLAHVWLDPDADLSGHALLEDAGLLPTTSAVFLRGGQVLADPTNADLAQAVGLTTAAEPSTVYDVVVVGAGPAGLAASVYASSEGLRVATADAVSAGGQIGTTTRFENYLGFPAGISGEEFASRALLQARRFGTTVVIPGRAVSLEARDGFFVVSLDTSDPLIGRSVIIAAGIEYRRLPVAGIDRYEGVSVFYSPLNAEHRVGKEAPVVVVGGGNSAGQAATSLAAAGHPVSLVVRGSNLSGHMVRYLVDRVEHEASIQVLTDSEVAGLAGLPGLEKVTVDEHGTLREIAAEAMFVLIGAAPYTGWLGTTVRLDDAGYVLTGTSLGDDGQQAEPWRSLGRGPFPLETSLPGVFAAGDVRSDSFKRVGSAVGDGSLATILVHRWLAR
jgi:thioredoxin reductase (NADPH)